MNRYLKNVDISILSALVLLVDKKSVTQAAKEMHMTQSAMSHVLNKLRNILNDPILIRSEKGMIATQKAIDTSLELAPIILKIQDLLLAKDSTGIEEKKEIVICTPEYFDLLIMPELRIRCDSDITLINDAAVNQVPLDELTDGRIKLLVTFESHLSIPDSLSKEFIKDELLTCVVSSNHPITKKLGNVSCISKAEYLALNHVDIYPFGFGFNDIDTLLDKDGMRRNINIKVPTYAAGMALVESQFYAATIPYNAAIDLAKRYAVTLLSMPTDLNSTKINLVWHPAHDQDKSLQWLRTNIKDIIQAL